MKKAYVLQLKISLHGSKPLIWREIIVLADYSFFDLHVAIQNSFGWTDSHLHQFFTESPYKGHSKNIAWPMPDMDADLDERKVKVYDFLKNEKDSLFYEYDFGDSWMHKIELRKTLDADSKTKYPQIISGKNACPPEDCGSLWGYYDLIKIINNPKHKERENMMEWLGIDDQKEFDPKYFNKDEVVFENPKKVLKEYENNFSFSAGCSEKQKIKKNDQTILSGLFFGFAIELSIKKFYKILFRNFFFFNFFFPFRYKM